ncbi:MAG: amino acid-binding protein [Sphingomonadaceae bacterium]|nr:amino acid-binding protein [Sphingomonadaceae bacterium]
MRMEVIMMAVGDDRPGLTQSLADAIVDANGNWLESHFARLGGKYVGSVLVALPADKLTVLERAAGRMDASGLTVTIQPASGDTAETGRKLGFELVGKDRPGIVREVSTALAGLSVSIDSLETATEEGAMFGGTVFRARAEVLVPETVSFDSVRSALEEISGEIMVDFDD